MGFDNEIKHASACFFSAPCRRGPCDYGDPEKVYRRYLDKGVSMIQTDRPELLIGYLTKAGRHTLR